MLRLRWLAIVTAIGSLSAGIAVAASRSSETTPITADFQASLSSQKERPCDASHSEFRVRFDGSQTSSDPRLTGALEVRVRTVVNTQNGSGYTTGTVLIRDTAGGRPKFHGRFTGVLEPDGGTEGFLIGRTSDRHPVQLLANFNVQQDPTGAITGELGKDSQTGSSQDPAVLTNACLGASEKGRRDDNHRGRDHHGRNGWHGDRNRHDQD